MILSYTGGAGGHWLKRLLLQEPYQSSMINFHQETQSDRVHVTHQFDPLKFDYFYTGKTYYNFYTNMLQKCYYNENSTQYTYSEFLLTCVSTALFVCSFDKIHHLRYFDFDHLTNNPEQFHKQVVGAQTKFNLPLVEYQTFLEYRTVFVDTCVNVSYNYEDFNDLIWVCFVLGQLQYKNIYPSFPINDANNQDLIKEFSLDNYKHCNFRDIWLTNNSVFLPNNFLPGANYQ